MRVRACACACSCVCVCVRACSCVCVGGRKECKGVSRNRCPGTTLCLYGCVNGKFRVRRTRIEIRISFSIRRVTMKYQGEGLARLMQRCYFQAFENCGMSYGIKV